MDITHTELPGVMLFEPRVHRDSRGFFLETWSHGRYAEAGVPDTMMQDNLSWSRRGVLRGMHFQHPVSQGKLIYVLAGEIYDVAVDVRVGSPHFGRWVGFDLSLENHRQLYIPAGFAHGFCVQSATALVAYKCTAAYQPGNEVGIAWNDPSVGIRWPIVNPIVSPKDAILRRLDQLPAESLPKYADAANGAPTRPAVSRAAA